jgi:lysophospholipase L1-like esterase
MRTWSRFVAVGDSFTEGLTDDPGPNGRHRGWADRVALFLSRRAEEFRYANLAVRGRLLHQIVTEQLPAARDLRPDLVTFHGGANDVLRPGVDMRRIRFGYDGAVAALRSTGADVVVFTVTSRQSPRTRVSDALQARFDAFNEQVWASADRWDATVVDLASVAVLRDPRLWHDDRLHLVADGHRRVAAAVLDALGVDDPAASAPGWWKAALPPAARPQGVALLTEEARWVRGHLLPWIGRRLRGVSSGDEVQPKHRAWHQFAEDAYMDMHHLADPIGPTKEMP